MENKKECICFKCGRILEGSSLNTMRWIPYFFPDRDDESCLDSSASPVCMPCFEDYAKHTTGDIKSIDQWWDK